MTVPNVNTRYAQSADWFVRGCELLATSSRTCREPRTTTIQFSSQRYILSDRTETTSESRSRRIQVPRAYCKNGGLITLVELRESVLIDGSHARCDRDIDPFVVLYGTYVKTDFIATDIQGAFEHRTIEILKRLYNSSAAKLCGLLEGMFYKL